MTIDVENFFYQQKIEFNGILALRETASFCENEGRAKDLSADRQAQWTAGQVSWKTKTLLLLKKLAIIYISELWSTP
mgnify:CR=1 FL=1